MHFLALTLIIPQLVASLNILVHSPAYAGSHTSFMANLADTLTEAGHNVTFLVPIVDEARRSQLGVKITKDVVVVEHDEETKRHILPVDDNINNLWTMDIHSSNAWKMFTWFDKAFPLACDNFLRNRRVHEEMKSRNFDVAIIEPFTVCGLGFIRSIGVLKTIVVSSCTHYDFVLPHIGESLEESYMPTSFSQFDDQMNLLKRLENYRVSRATSSVFEGMFDEETKVYRKYLGDHIPDWKELLAQSSLHFTNANPIIDFPRPALQKTIAIGGVAVDMQKMKSEILSREFDAILEKRKINMLISFGSLVASSGMPSQWRQNILDVIRSEPNVTFIWKYETDDVEFARGVDNVHFSKWVPQKALLVDPRLTAFLTHGGLGSTNELAYCGKPALMIPVFADQARNANMLARHKSAIALRKTDLGDFELLRRSVKSILYEKTYLENAKRIAELLENQPTRPKELAIRYTEFVGRYGPFPELDPYSRHLNWFQKNLLDAYLLVASVYICALSAITWTAYKILGRFVLIKSRK